MQEDARAKKRLKNKRYLIFFMELNLQDDIIIISYA